MNVLMASSKEYLKYLKVLLFSLFESKSDDTYDIYVMYHEEITGVGGYCLTELSRWMEQYSARLHPVYVPDDYYNAATKCKKTFNPSAIYRHSYAELLPQNIDRVLLLGIDMIIRGSLKELYHTEIAEDKCFVMCKDMGAAYSDEHYSRVRQAREASDFGADFFNQWYNTDMILIDLKKCRDKFNFGDFVDFIQTNQFVMIDQDALSYKYGALIQETDAFLYNFLVSINMDDARYRKWQSARIIHYASDRKPWRYQDDSWYNKLWWSYAKRCFKEEEYEQLETNLQVRMEQKLLEAYRNASLDIAFASLKYQLYYDFFCRFENSRTDGKIQFTLDKNQKIAVYGYGNVGRLVYQELLSSGYTVSCVIDMEEHAEIATIPPDRIDTVDADVIVVTPIYDFYKIKEEFGGHCHAQMVSALDIV